MISLVNYLLSLSSSLEVAAFLWLLHLCLLKVAGTPFSMLVGAEAKLNNVSVPAAFAFQKICSGAFAAIISLYIERKILVGTVDGGGSGGSDLKLFFFLAGCATLPIAFLLHLTTTSIVSNGKRSLTAIHNISTSNSPLSLNTTEEDQSSNKLN